MKGVWPDSSVYVKSSIRIQQAFMSERMNSSGTVCTALWFSELKISNPSYHTKRTLSARPATNPGPLRGKWNGLYLLGVLVPDTYRDGARQLIEPSHIKAPEGQMSLLFPASR